MSHDHDRRDHYLEPPSEDEARALALESLLIEKGLLTSADVDAVIAAYENDIGPMLGARIVAHAWVDSEFRTRLLEDGTHAVHELGVDYPERTPLFVVEWSRRS